MADMGQRRRKNAAPALWHKETQLPFIVSIVKYQSVQHYASSRQGDGPVIYR